MRWLALLSVLLAACAHGQKTSCPDTTPLDCLGGSKKCEADRDGCQICTCVSTMIQRGNEPGPGQAPFPR